MIFLIIKLLGFSVAAGCVWAVGRYYDEGYTGDSDIQDYVILCGVCLAWGTCLWQIIMEICNMAKNNLPREEFLDRIVKIHKNMKKLRNHRVKKLSNSTV